MKRHPVSELPPRFPVVDLFAGPGGLAEGFSALRLHDDNAFKVVLSIEKDPFAHRTLQLRAFLRQFPEGEAPQDYYDYLAGKLSRSELLGRHPEQSAAASGEAWLAELGAASCPAEAVDRRIRAVLRQNPAWVLIGGPPCQAYSLAGRSRRKHDPSFAADEKHLLYLQYLRIIAVHRPPVFVMENVKGLLSARHQADPMLNRILSDLEAPLNAFPADGRRDASLKYRVVSVVADNPDLLGRCLAGDYVVRAEDYGIPQARHRVILLGIRSDVTADPRLLESRKQVTVRDVVSDLPRLRSGLSKEEDGGSTWLESVREIRNARWLQRRGFDEAVRAEILMAIDSMTDGLSRGSDVLVRSRKKVKAHRDWFSDSRLRGICNHSTRSHIRQDLHRYFFVAAYGRVHGKSPLLDDMPTELLPKHENVGFALLDTKFNDRFRVQLADRPSSTVTSHISKDGHYFIHYDPTQCRSLTVREAARLQTFPDNYFFEGPRTQQYQQVGNAVPPLLARQIAAIVHELLR